MNKWKVLLITAFLLCARIAAVSAATYYIDPKGNDGNTGISVHAPWQTVDKVNATAFQPGDRILFKKGGTWYGALMPNVSGTARKPIFFGAYGSGAKPVISGFTALSGWTSVGGGIWQAPCAYCGSTVNMVTLNNIEQQIGRYPNADAVNGGYLTIASHSVNSITSPALAGSWTGADVVIRDYRWQLDKYAITAQSGTTVAHAVSTSQPTDGFGFFIQNSPQTLDQLGEWYFNPVTKNLEMYFGSADPSSYAAKVSTVPVLATIAKNYIVLNGLSFQGSTTSGVAVSNSTNVSLQNIAIGFSGTDGIDLDQANYFTLQHSTIDTANNNGIFFSFAGGSGNASISNNSITTIGMKAGMGGNGPASLIGIYVAEAVGNDNEIISQNSIRHSGYTGIYFSGNGAVVKNNTVANFCSVTDDGAGIYTWNGFTPPLVHSNRQITGNIISGGKGATAGTNDAGYVPVNGIYMDDNTDHVSIIGNTVTGMPNAGVFLHKAIDITVKGNTLVRNVKDVYAQAN
ncbi:MAG: parallel beta-helix repeat containing protein [Candidatus Nomurabacteria bacterium]|jgi:hypothetical protein|nr:parallel beta-helix repeat containing protein [Candidatus Nomurabacteria bacterium]